jgi:hypothetical protein
MAKLMAFPEDCRVMIVEPEPIQAMTLECLLDEFSCRRIGPVGSLPELEELLAKRRPSFALVAADLDDELEPVAATLDELHVPFALLAIGPKNDLIDQSSRLRDRPRVRRPFHAPTLHSVMSTLYRHSVSIAVAAVECHIEEGRERLARQLRLIERLAERGHDTAKADALAREYGRLLQTMRASREILTRRLENFSG